MAKWALGLQILVRTVRMSTPLPELTHWSEAHRQQIHQAIEGTKDTSYSFAVFDADNTIWKYDLIEALLAWMGNTNEIQLHKLPAELIPVPLRDDETLISYYDFLCDIDHSLAYLFASQVFTGFTLGELRTATKTMMAQTENIVVPIRGDQQRAVPIPKIFPAQIELIHTLQSHGIEVWIVSASLEEVVRMVASDPAFGINLPPEKVIGVNLMLQKPSGDVTVGALERQAGYTGLEYYLGSYRMKWVMGTFPFAPLTWYAGKLAAIQEWIDPDQRPILVAGDSRNDFYMQFYCDVESGGVRLRIHRKDTHKKQLEREISRRQSDTANANPTLGWLEVTATDLGCPIR